MTTYSVIGVMNNKFPCNGGSAIPLPLNFDPVSGGGALQPINLAIVAQRGQIQDIQAFFIDNADNAASLIIQGGALQQRIKIPPNSQGYVNMLLDQQPTITVSTTTATGLVVTIYAINIPVTNAVWKSQ
jgi:hypothetical protein